MTSTLGHSVFTIGLLDRLSPPPPPPTNCTVMYIDKRCCSSHSALSVLGCWFSDRSLSSAPSQNGGKGCFESRLQVSIYADSSILVLFLCALQRLLKAVVYSGDRMTTFHWLSLKAGALVVRKIHGLALANLTLLALSTWTCVWIHRLPRSINWS